MVVGAITMKPLLINSYRNSPVNGPDYEFNYIDKNL